MTTPRGLLTARATLSPFRGTFNGRLHEGLGIQAYAAFTTTSALALAGGLVLTGQGIRSPIATLVLAAIAFYAESQPIRITPTVHCSVLGVLVTFAAVLLGPISAIVVALVGSLPDLRADIGQPLLRWTVWTSTRVLTAGAAGLAVIATTGPHPGAPSRLLTAVAVAAAVDLFADLVLAPLPAVLRGSSGWLDLVRVIGPMQLSALPVQLPLICVLAYGYVHVSGWGLVLFVVPAFAAQRLYLMYRQQREASEELTRVNERLSKAGLSFAAALVATLDARDEYTAGHSAAVAVYAHDIARQLGLPPSQREMAHLAGLVHDIGKVGLPSGLLEKPGPLTLRERRQMQDHPVIGERILAKIEDYADIANIVRHHHERVDGSGYPDGLAGDEIPMISAIIAVADAYDAMTSDRPYREAMSSTVARMRLAQAAGTQFDIGVIAAFEAVLATAPKGYGSRELRAVAQIHAAAGQELRSVATLA